MPAVFNVLALLGNNAQTSAHRSILEYLGMRSDGSYSLSISDWPPMLPHFNPDFGVHDLPIEVGMFREEIELADAVIFCVPESAGSMPGMIKNCLEWTLSTSLFSGKPIALISTSDAGDEAHTLLLRTLRAMEADVSKEQTLLIAETGMWSNERDEPVDAQLVTELEGLTSALLERIPTLRGQS